MYELDADKHAKNTPANAHVKLPAGPDIICNKYVCPNVNGNKTSKKQQHIIQKLTPSPSL
jgi:hypothetical protein